MQKRVVAYDNKTKAMQVAEKMRSDIMGAEGKWEYGVKNTENGYWAPMLKVLTQGLTVRIFKVENGLTYMAAYQLSGTKGKWATGSSPANALYRLLNN